MKKIITSLTLVLLLGIGSAWAGSGSSQSGDSESGCSHSSKWQDT